jgi:hypothetical protein
MNFHTSIPKAFPPIHALTVRLLVSGTGTWTAEFLWLTSSVIGDEEGTVVGDESSLQLLLGVLIDVFLVVGNDRLRDSLTDGVDLRCVTTTGNSDADINAGELVETNDEKGLVDLW